MLQKLSEHYKVDIVPNAAGNRLELKTDNDKIVKHCEKLVSFQKTFEIFV